MPNQENRVKVHTKFTHSNASNNHLRKHPSIDLSGPLGADDISWPLNLDSHFIAIYQIPHNRQYFNLTSASTPQFTLNRSSPACFQLAFMPQGEKVAFR